jgi:hypothetical protein
MNRSSWPALLLFAAAAIPVPHGRSDDRFSAFLNLGTKFQDDYQSVDGSLGIRWRW